MKNTALRLSVVVGLLPLLLDLVYGDYRLLVRTYSYSNPSNRCGGCFPVGSCCDAPGEFDNCGGSERCDNVFSYCLRAVGSSPGTQCSNSETSETHRDSDDPVDYSQNTVLGLPNPLPLDGTSTQWNGAQFYLVVFDQDGSGGVFVDSFTIDFSSTDLPVGVEMTRMTFNGSFGFAFTELSFRVVCAQNYYGPDCSQFCEGNCACDPGFTGQFCHINIDDCVAVNCSENGQCVDGNNTYECVCDPGFTGDQCEVNIDDCMEDSCNGNGQCVDVGVNIFNCTCDPGFTGDQCEENIDDCVKHNCSGNGQCTDGVETFTCNCNLGFTGRMCEENIDNCVRVNCSGNGQCRDNGLGVNSYTCECNSGFTGELCSQAITTTTEAIGGSDSQIVTIIVGAVLGALVVLLLLALLVVVVMAVLSKRQKSYKPKKSAERHITVDNSVYYSTCKVDPDVSKESQPTSVSAVTTTTIDSNNSIPEHEFDNPLYGDNDDATHTEYATPSTLYSTVNDNHGNEVLIDNEYSEVKVETTGQEQVYNRLVRK